MIYEVAQYLGINPERTDLMWVAVFVVLHYHQYINIESEEKDWSNQLAYFNEILSIQEVYRSKLIEKFKRPRLQQIIKCLSWIGLYDVRQRRQYYKNFLTQEQVSVIPTQDARIINRYFKY